MSRSNETNQVERAAQGEGKRAKHTARWMFECMGREVCCYQGHFHKCEIEANRGNPREAAGREEFDTIEGEVSGFRAWRVHLPPAGSTTAGSIIVVTSTRTRTITSAAAAAI